MQFVGSLRSGSMSDNYHEGHPGWVIRLVTVLRAWMMHVYPRKFNADLVAIVELRMPRQPRQTSDPTSSCEQIPDPRTPQMAPLTLEQDSRRHQRSPAGL